MMRFSNIAVSQSLNPLLPLDAYPNALGAWFLTKVKSSFVDAACTLRRSSDNALTDVFFDNTGKISGSSLTSSASTLSTWAGADTLYVASITDQTRSGRFLATNVTAYQPTLLLNSINGHAVRSYSGTQRLMLSSALNVEFNSFFCLHNIPTSANRGVIFSNFLITGNNDHEAFEKNSSNLFRVFWAGADLAISVNNMFGSTTVTSVVRDVSVPNTSIYKNNTNDRSTPDVRAAVTNVLAHCEGADQRNVVPSSAIPLTGNISGIIIYSATITEAQRSAITLMLATIGGISI